MPNRLYKHVQTTDIWWRFLVVILSGTLPLGSPRAAGGKQRKSSQSSRASCGTAPYNKLTAAGRSSKRSSVYWYVGASHRCGGHGCLNWSTLRRSGVGGR